MAQDSPVRVLVIDNYDSFTFNLVQYLLELGAVVDVYPNDALTPDQVTAAAPSHLLLSPGPGRPAEAGICPELCRRVCTDWRIPTLGVCLGHQALCEVLGARVVGAEQIMHGKTSEVQHRGQGILRELPSPFRATRYHSLLVETQSLPAGLVATAQTAQGELMAVEVAQRPVFGIQFHPESVLSEYGHALLDNFLAEAP